MNKRVMTRDGSPSLESERWGCAFHSRHGALTEAMHVYIHHGLAYAATRHPGTLHLLEMGAGTGFNAALAAEWAHKNARKLIYTGVDLALPQADEWEAWKMGWSHRPAWMTRAEGLRAAWTRGEPYQDEWVHARFQMGEAPLAPLPGEVHCVFYDAFSPSQQPELWTAEALGPWLKALHTKGCLVTYCARGHVFRAVQTLGYAVEHVPGPPGKREMLRATVA
jgi:tRNA U34 5-methylaminomethyl-2-thiouridine-forming methyltransferase MnmC